MTYKQRQQAIVHEYYNGATIEELAIKYSFTIKVIQALIRLKKYQNDPNFFNVNEFDCWLIPTTSERKTKTKTINNDGTIN